MNNSSGLVADTSNIGLTHFGTNNFISAILCTFRPEAADPQHYYYRIISIEASDIDILDLGFIVLSIYLTKFIFTENDS